MHILVTGGAGFIGSHVTSRALSDGHRVTVVDDFSTGKRSNVPHHDRLRLLEADLGALATAEWPEGIDAVVHLAANPSVTGSWSELQRNHDLNLTNSVRVMESARDLGIPRLVFASSAAVYGDGVPVPTSEDAPKEPISPYGLQKLVSEHYGRLVAGQTSLEFVGLRFFNVFGPGQVAGSVYSGVITKFLDLISRGGDLTVFGDGRQTRDFVYVKDIARAVLAAVSAPLGEDRACSLNIGSGQAASILELIATLRALHPEWKGSVQFSAPVHGDILHSRACIRKAEACLGYVPQWDLRSGLADMLGRA